MVKKIDLKHIQDARKKHNSELIKRMLDGESLKSFDSTQSWFPPRPVIKKDPKALEKLYHIHDKPLGNDTQDIKF